jgi:hypothetical protein
VHRLRRRLRLPDSWLRDVSSAARCTSAAAFADPVRGRADEGVARVNVRDRLWVAALLLADLWLLALVWRALVEALA